jgi:hypothetical protein
MIQPRRRQGLLQFRGPIYERKLAFGDIWPGYGKASSPAGPEGLTKISLNNASIEIPPEKLV